MALELGYRHVDTAQMYDNEADVGKAIADSGLRREDVFIVSKVHPENFSTDRFQPSVRRSLDDLSIASLDLLLLHWPPLDQPIEPVVELLQQAHDLGYAKSIGVSNFTPRLLERACQVGSAPIVINQVEFHPPGPVGLTRSGRVLWRRYCGLLSIGTGRGDPGTGDPRNRPAPRPFGRTDCAAVDSSARRGCRPHVDEAEECGGQSGSAGFFSRRPRDGGDIRAWRARSTARLTGRFGSGLGRLVPQGPRLLRLA